MGTKAETAKKVLEVAINIGGTVAAIGGAILSSMNKKQ